MLVDSVFDSHQFLMRALFGHLSVPQHDDEVWKKTYSLVTESGTEETGLVLTGI
jgi:hypothetical protein